MQFDTILKLGSLAFGVAQDEKVRELATMIHQGGKRRGMWGAPGQMAIPHKPGTSGLAATEPAESAPAKPAVPFAPKTAQHPAAVAAVGGGAGLNVGKYMTKDNLKKALDIAGQVGTFLVK